MTTNFYQKTFFGPLNLKSKCQTLLGQTSEATLYVKRWYVLKRHNYGKQKPTYKVTYNWLVTTRNMAEKVTKTQNSKCFIIGNRTGDWTVIDNVQSPEDAFIIKISAKQSKIFELLKGWIGEIPYKHQSFYVPYN